MRRVIVVLAAGVIGGAVAVHGEFAFGQRFPHRAIAVVVGNAAGGGIDMVARLLASGLTERLGQPVVVENRPGAAARVASAYVARAAPDGYTLLVATAVGAIESELRDEGVEGALQAFAPVAALARAPMILVVTPTLPVGDVLGLVARARAQPGVLNYASSGIGTTGHLYGELFKVRTGTDIVHVPYRGTAPALTALIAGDVELTFAPIPGVLQHVREGRLRALATTGERRSRQMPDVPTMAEAGVTGLDASIWYSVFAPPATPPEIVDALARAIVDAAQSPELRQRLLDLGAEPAAVVSAPFAALLRSELVRWTPVIKSVGSRPE